MTAISADTAALEAARPRVNRSTNRRAGVVLLPADLVAATLVVAVTLLVGWSGRGAETLLFVPAWVCSVAAVGEYRLPGSLAIRSRRLALVALVLPTGVLLTTEILGYSLQATKLVPVCILTAFLCWSGRALAMTAARRGVRVQGLTHRIVVVGTASAVPHLLRLLNQSPFPRFVAVGACLADGRHDLSSDLPVAVGLDRCVDAVADLGADGVILLPDPTIDPLEMRRLQWLLEDTDTKVFVSSGLLGTAVGRTTLDGATDLTLLHLCAPRRKGSVRWVKRVVERAVALVALLLLSPLLAALAVAIRLDSPGPAFFRQTRVGKDDTRFTMWKLRTMTCGAEHEVDALRSADEGAGVLFKIREDPRVTDVGRWLRRTSLDELPQLINVVLGQMSLVGPRPALPAEVERYHPDVRHRLVVEPGITGLWQVSGRSDLSWEESVRLDQRYVDNWSLLLDIGILARTVVALVRRTGAY